MATSKRIGIYSIAGIAAAIMIVAAIFASGVQIPSQSPNPSQSPSQSALGTLSISIKDAPVDLANLDVTIDGLYVKSAQYDTWIELNFIGDVQEVSFDLLALKDVTQQLSLSQIPAGDYSKIRLDVKTAVATYSDSTAKNLHIQELRVPPGHIDIIISFHIAENQVTDLLIDMQPDSAAISNSGNFKPILKATVS